MTRMLDWIKIGWCALWGGHYYRLERMHLIERRGWKIPYHELHCTGCPHKALEPKTTQARRVGQRDSFAKINLHVAPGNTLPQLPVLKTRS